MQFVALLDAPQDRHRIGNRRLVDVDGLEPPGKGCILLHMLAVLIQRGRADAVKVAPRQGRLEQVRGVHRPFGLAGPDERVQLVDEENDLARRRIDVRKHGLQPLLEFAAVFCAGDKRSHVKRHDPLRLEALGNVAPEDPDREPLGNRGLADARIADENRIVLGPAAQHLHRAPDFVIAADDGIDVALARRQGQVAGVALQRLVSRFGGPAVRRPALPDVVDRLVQRPAGRPCLLKDPACVRAHQGKRGEEPLGRYEAVPCLVGQLLRLFQDPRRLPAECGPLILPFDAWQLGQGDVRRLSDLLGACARPLNQVCRQPVGIIKQ